MNSRRFSIGTSLRDETPNDSWIASGLRAVCSGGLPKSRRLTPQDRTFDSLNECRRLTGETAAAERFELVDRWPPNMLVSRHENSQEAKCDSPTSACSLLALSLPVYPIKYGAPRTELVVPPRTCIAIQTGRVACSATSAAGFAAPWNLIQASSVAVTAKGTVLVLHRVLTRFWNLTATESSSARGATDDQPRGRSRAFRS